MQKPKKKSDFNQKINKQKITPAAQAHQKPGMGATPLKDNRFILTIPPISRSIHTYPSNSRSDLNPGMQGTEVAQLAGKHINYTGMGDSLENLRAAAADEHDSKKRLAAGKIVALLDNTVADEEEAKAKVTTTCREVRALFNQEGIIPATIEIILLQLEKLENLKLKEVSSDDDSDPPPPEDDDSQSDDDRPPPPPPEDDDSQSDNDGPPPPPPPEDNDSDDEKQNDVQIQQQEVTAAAHRLFGGKCSHGFAWSMKKDADGVDIWVCDGGEHIMSKDRTKGCTPGEINRWETQRANAELERGVNPLNIVIPKSSIRAEELRVNQYFEAH